MLSKPPAHDCRGMRFAGIRIALVLVAGMWPAATLALGITLNVVGGPAVAGRPFELVLWLDTEGEAVNAAEAILHFSADQFAPPEFRDGDSILKLWVRPPTVAGNEIRFAGVIPGGFSGRGKLLSVMLTSRRAGTWAFTLSGASVYRHDGSGTAVSIATSTQSVPVVAEDRAPAPARAVGAVSDTTPPEVFVPVVTRDPAVGDGAWFVVFATQDKGVGVDHYEVAETAEDPRAVSAAVAWPVATSPHVLADQTRRSYVGVKAVDRAGNVRLAVLPPMPAVNAGGRWRTGAMAVGAVVLFALAKVWHGRLRRRRAV